MTHLLVTGGLGFIGSHIVEAAVARGWRVTVVDSLRSDVHASTEVPDWFTGLRGDVELLIRDAGDVPEKLLRSVDAVSHQAAKVGLGVDFGDAPDYMDSNPGVTARLLAAMAVSGPGRLVLASSMVVYGEGLYRDGDAVTQPPARAVDDLRAGRFEPLDRRGRPLHPLLITEDDPTEPRNVYAVSKLAQEQLSRSWARSTGGSVVALRYHNVFGARMPIGTPYAGVASIFRSSLARGEAPRVFEDGRQRRDFVDVRDVAAANIRALEWLDGRPEGTVETFNVGSGTVRTIGEFASALAEAVHGPSPVVTGEFRLGDVRHITASSERIAAQLGWHARVPWAEAVRAFAKAPMRVPVGSRKASARAGDAAASVGWIQHVSRPVRSRGDRIRVSDSTPVHPVLAHRQGDDEDVEGGERREPPREVADQLEALVADEGHQEADQPGIRPQLVTKHGDDEDHLHDPMAKQVDGAEQCRRDAEAAGVVE